MNQMAYATGRPLNAIFSKRTEPRGLAKLVRASRPTMLESPTANTSQPAANSSTPSSMENGMMSPIVPITAIVKKMPEVPICQNAAVLSTSERCRRGLPICTLGGCLMTASPKRRITTAMTASQRMPRRQPYSASSR